MFQDGQIKVVHCPKKKKDFGICIKPTIGTSNIEKKMLGQDWEPCGMGH